MRTWGTLPCCCSARSLPQPERSQEGGWCLHGVAAPPWLGELGAGAGARQRALGTSPGAGLLGLLCSFGLPDPGPCGGILKTPLGSVASGFTL